MCTQGSVYKLVLKVEISTCCVCMHSPVVMAWELNTFPRLTHQHVHVCTSHITFFCTPKLGVTSLPVAVRKQTNIIIPSHMDFMIFQPQHTHTSLQTVHLIPQSKLISTHTHLHVHITLPTNGYRRQPRAQTADSSTKRCHENTSSCDSTTFHHVPHAW